MMQYTGTDRVHLYACRKSGTLAHLLYSCTGYSGRALIIDYRITMKLNDEFAPSRLQHSGFTIATTLHVLNLCHARVTPVQAQSAIGIGNHSNVL